MNLPENTHLAYIVWHEAWYSQDGYTSIPGEHPHLMVSASADGGGCAWEFQIDGYDLSGPVTRVKMFMDSYAAFAQVPEFFTALTEQQPGTLAEVRAILDALGAVDETPRVSPYPERKREPASADAVALERIAEVLQFAHKEPPLSQKAVTHMITALDTIVRATGRNHQD